MSDEEVIQEEQVSILDYLFPLLRWRWLIFVGTIGLAIVGVLVALSKSPYYTATAYFVPRGALGETDELRALAGSSGKDWRSVRSAGDMVKYYNVALKARALMDRMLETTFVSAEDGESSLMNMLLRNSNAEQGDQARRAIEALRGKIDVGSAGGKILTVSISSSEAQLAADLVNALLKEFETQPRRSQEASADLLFIESRLEEVGQKLEAKERQIAEAESRALDAGQPDAIQRRVALEREARLLEKLYEDLNAEHARAEIRAIQAKREAGGEIEILDEAEPPLSRSGPNRRKIVLVFAFIGAVLTGGAAFTIEYFRNAQRQLQGHPFWGLVKRSRRDLVIMAIFAVAIFLLALIYYAVR